VAKFPTEVERTITVKVPLARAYEYLWDVVGSSGCIPGIDSCKRTGKDTYRFAFEERSTGPVSLSVRYTARYETNGSDSIRFASANASGDNTDVEGSISLKVSGAGSTRITLRQKVAPETPIPRLLQGLVKSLVEREAAEAVQTYLANVKRQLEGRG
jgi:carbon monoxide dehydrogenase subunit G